MGQRSQIYVRASNNLLAANYFQWNFSERMISRARWSIDWIRNYQEDGVFNLLFEEHDSTFHFFLVDYVERLQRVLDVNFDLHNIAHHCDIVKEYWKQFSDEPFNKAVFEDQNNNDGQLFIEILPDKVRYCFRDVRENRLMDAEQYMVWDSYPHWEFDDQHNLVCDGEYLSEEEIEACKRNIKAIGEMAELMTVEQLEDFLHCEYIQAKGEGQD